MTSSLREDYDSYGHPRIPFRGYYDRSSCNERRAWAEKFGSCSLKHCGQWWHNEGKDDSCSCSKLKGNIENPIGLAKVPLAVCGPLLFKSEHVNGYCLCPFATTEGALVASITRGAVAITRSGGVYAKVQEQTQVRSPFFRLRSIGEVHLFCQWICNHCDQIKDRVKLSSQHANLKKLDVVCADRVVLVHFKYSTGDACGQNMVTSVTSYLCQWILLQVQKELPQIKVLHFCIESGLSGDKKMSFANLANTRGFHVQAEAWISEEILKSVLKVDVSTLMTCYNEWHHLQAGFGITGFNSNVPNLVAGVCIATGQDPASVESSHAVFSLSRVSSAEMPLENGKLKDRGTVGLYASISLPSLNVGTVGGGTSLATQKECLQLIDCYGKDGALRLCEVIAGYALSLELSTFSALASGQFASAHEKLGRNHPTLGLKDSHLNQKFFAEVLSAHGKVVSVAPFQVNTGNSILSEVTKSEMSKKVGHFGFSIQIVDSEGTEEALQVVIKSKATALETCNMLNKIAQSCGLELAVEYQKHKMELGFNYSDVREVQVYSMMNKELHSYFPTLYYTVMEPSKDIFLIIMEYLSDKNYTHLDTINSIEDWSLSDIKIVLKDLARLHSIFFMKTEHLEEAEWIEMRSTKRQRKTDMLALWNELLKHANYEFPKMWNQHRVSIMKNAILHIDIIDEILAGAPSTLIHNDCNPRNLCLRKHPVQLKEPEEVCALCLYDWELATIDVPQRDLVEFLTFTLSPATPINVRVDLIEFYRHCLENFSGSVYPIDRFVKVFNLSMLDFGEPLFVSVQQGDLRVLMQLLSKDISGVNITDETGQTLLHSACAHGQIDIVLYLLQLRKCKLDIQEQIYGHTPLHIACLYDNQRIVQELVKAYSRSDFIKKVDKFGWSSLHHAARNGNLDICTLLIAHGADPSQLNEVGKSACHYAAEHGHSSVLQYLYDDVVSVLIPPILSKSVLENPTLLHCAAFYGQADIAAFLQTRSFPPAAKSRRILDNEDKRICDQYPDEVADSRNHSALKTALLSYRQTYEGWIDDIMLDKVTLDRIKLCICGFPRVGKSAMRESLSRPYLQTLLNKAVEETDEADMDRHTFGIEITSMQLSGRDIFSVWDFAGQVENFITHQFFISTQNTVFTVLVNLTDPLEEQRRQLMRWLGFIKMRNLGQTVLSTGLMEFEKDTVPMANSRSEVFGKVLQCVPVIVVGSHYDQIPVHEQQEKKSSTQSLINEMKVKFEECLMISPQLYPLNCLKSVSPEIKSLKEHLCEVRSKLLEVQPMCPRVIELIARKIETLRVEHQSLKVMPWDDVRMLILNEVNKLLSDRQLSFILRCLTNAGVLVYFDQGALANYVFIDPGWLCKEVLGKALAPEGFPVARIASIGSIRISKETLEAKFKEYLDDENTAVIIELLQDFDLCYKVRDNDNYDFPAFIKESIGADMWKPETIFIFYCGRHLVCTEETDTFPPGFFSRLQVLISRVLTHEKIHHFKGSFLVDAVSYQCLVQINSASNSISLIGRAGKLCTLDALQLLDLIQSQIAILVRDICPTIFFELMIPSTVDLKQHRKPRYYSIYEVISKVKDSINSVAEETVTDLLYMGDKEYQKSHEGKETKVAYIPMEIILQVQELLSDGDTDWKDLAKAINLEKYVQFLESRAPESTRLLLLKWAEKPKWTVNSLLSALKQIGRMDVFVYIRARF